MSKQYNAERPTGIVRTPDDVSSGIRRFIQQHSEKAALDHFGLSRVAIARAAAGLPVQGGTLLALRDGLKRAEEL